MLAQMVTRFNTHFQSVAIYKDQLNYSGVCPNDWHGFQSFRNHCTHTQNASQNTDIKVINSITKNWYSGFVLIILNRQTQTLYIEFFHRIDLLKSVYHSFCISSESETGIMSQIVNFLPLIKLMHLFHDNVRKVNNL